ncbi:translation initiation inhibitor [Subtercola boreus]|uniref:Translation initiation inhibitor n=1 Tax=Subtercola boreus TaxID=120213 RepID=A0A3E0VLD6_9MICO|nr:RidA family protein [Subtercola boreus]RFA10240.1 translation initiation inhibitor [Subtercola boreus]TQL52584.1 enamine deaminase RidA (YjgF/YER057c/UK114 family) [Subtercola boreus]
MILPPGPILFVGGQNGVDAAGALLDGLEAQVAQAMRNVLAVLAEAGSGPELVAKLTIHLAPGVDPAEAFAATQSVWGFHRTAVTVLAVAPARPGALVEVEAIAALQVQ